MIELDIRADMKEIERELTAVQKKHIPKAASRAINRAISKVQTETRRSVSKEMGVQQKRIKDSFYIRKASPLVLAGVLSAQGRPIKLVYFNSTRATKAGVKSKAYGKLRTYPGTFKTTMRTGHTGVFRRVGSSRLPIKELYGPSVPKTMAQRVIRENMERTGRKVFITELRRQLTRVLR